LAIPALRAAPNALNDVADIAVRSAVRSSEIHAATVDGHEMRAFHSPELATPAAPAQPPGASRVGQTTAQPVSRDWTTAPSETGAQKAYPVLVIGGKPVAPRLLVIAGLVAATLAVGAGAFLATSIGKSAAPTADPSAASALARAAGESSVPAPVETLASPPPPQGAKPPVPQLGPAVPPSRPGTVPEVVSAMPAVASATPAVAPGTSTVGAGAAPATNTHATTDPPWAAPVSRFLGKAAAVSKSNCTPPFEYDAQGTKRWKRECLQR
jgi:hypothetical protein